MELWEDAEAIVFGFAQSCFIGAFSSAQSLAAEDRDWVKGLLQHARQLSIEDVAAWPAGKQLALRVVLTNTLIVLRTLKPGFATNDFEGSSSRVLSQPLMSAIEVLSVAVPA